MNPPPDPQPSILKPGETINEMGIRLFSERADPQQGEKICIDHKLALIERGYGSADAFSQLPTASKSDCFLCNNPITPHQPATEPSSQQGWKVADSGFDSIAQRYYVIIRADGRMVDIYHHDQDFLEATAKRIVEAVKCFENDVEAIEHLAEAIKERDEELHGLHQVVKFLQDETQKLSQFVSVRYELLAQRDAELKAAQDEVGRLREELYQIKNPHRNWLDAGL